MVKKILVIGITVLFLGIGIQPAIAEIPLSNDSEDEEECDICPKLNNIQLFKIKSLLLRLETLVNELSVISKKDPIVELKYQEFSKRFSVLKEINMDYMLYSFYSLCLLFQFIMISLCWMQ